MCTSVMAGEPFCFGDGDPRRLASADDWGPERTVRGEVLAALLVQVSEIGSPVKRVIPIQGARVTGPVNLSHTEASAFVHFGRCYFDETLDLSFARMRNLEMERCVLASVDATLAHIDGVLGVIESEVRSDVRLAGARVRSAVAFVGSTIAGDGRQAIGADGLEAGGDVVLHALPDGSHTTDEASVFNAKGEVRLLGARIGGDLRCSGGRFENPGRVALSTDRAEIRGEVRLDRGFHAAGEVRLWRTRIGSDLCCLGGSFENQQNYHPEVDFRDTRAQKPGRPLGEPGDYALRADGAEINGSAIMSKGFIAKGVVYLAGAQIGSDLNCSGGRFDNPGGDALAADSATIAGNARLDAGFHANGVVGLLGVRIAGQLNCSGGRFNCPNGRALGADSAEIKGNVNLTEGFHSSGEVRFLSARLRGQLNCTRGTFENCNKTALTLQEATLNSLWLRDLGCETAGQIVLTGARANLLADDPEVSARQGVEILLDGFVYERISSDAPQDVKTRLQWVRRQSSGYRPQPFDQLATVFRQNGQEQQARDVLIDKRRMRRENLRGWPSRSWDYLQDWTVLYGWQPWRSLAIGLVALLTVFGLVTAAQAAGLVVGPSDVVSSYHPLIHALDAFLPVIDLGLESRWEIDTAHGGWFAWLVRVSLWALPVVGWVTVTLALAAVTGIVKRE